MLLHTLESICYIKPHLNGNWRLTIETEQDHIIWSCPDHKQLEEFAEDYFLQLDEAIYWVTEGDNQWADRAEALNSFRTKHLPTIQSPISKLVPDSMRQPNLPSYLKNCGRFDIASYAAGDSDE